MKTDKIMDDRTKNINGLKEIVRILHGMGEKYRPANKKLAIKNLENKLKLLKKYQDELREKKWRWFELVNEREYAQQNVSVKLECITANNSGNADIDGKFKKDLKKLVKEIVIKIDGRSKSEGFRRMDESIKRIFLIQKNFDKKLEKIKRIYKMLESLTEAVLKKAIIDVPKINSLITNLIEKNEKVRKITFEMKTIDAEMDEIMFDKKNGVYELERLVTFYIVSLGDALLIRMIKLYRIKKV